MGKVIVKIEIGSDPLWPHRCVLCLGKVSNNISTRGEGKTYLAPYCAACFPKVIRRINLEGGVAMISVLITVITMITILIIGALNDVSIILQGTTCGVVFVGGPLLLGIIYLLGKLFLMICYQISGDKILKPGVKVTKSRTLNSVSLSFSNSHYADLFMEVNGIQ